MLLASVKSQRDFWEAVHKVSFKRKFVKIFIAVDDLFQHFRTLLEKEVNNDDIIDENSMLLLLISKKRLILLIEICYGLFC